MNIFRKQPKRLPLKDWVKMEDLRSRAEDRTQAPSVIREIVRLCGLRSGKEPWFDTVSKFTSCLLVNQPRLDFTVLTSKAKKNEKLPWEYPGRAWFFWVNLLGGHYGWTEDQIGRLDLDDAIGLYQEILVDEQLRDEWEYGLSENAYVYDKATKSSKFRPLPRPEWMRPLTPVIRPEPKIKIRADMLPQGNVVVMGQ